MARFRLRRADDVDEAYAAVYADAGTGLTIVYALQFKTAPVPNPPPQARDVLRLVCNDTLLVVTGDGRCSESVATYLKELAAP